MTKPASEILAGATKDDFETRVEKITQFVIDLERFHDRVKDIIHSDESDEKKLARIRFELANVSLGRDE